MTSSTSQTSGTSLTFYGGAGEIGGNKFLLFGITLHKAHCSGHAGKTDLKYAVRKIAPKILIPIHTRNPEEFKKIHDNVIIPKRGGTIGIR